MQQYKLDILGVSECRWTGTGKKTLNSGHTILYSGHNENHINGVAIIISKEKSKTLFEWEPVSDRLITARFDSKYCKLTIIQCYAPTNDSDNDIKDDFYEQLQTAISKTPQHDMLVTIGDLNAKVGSDNINIEQIMGKHGCGNRNENGERLIDLCTNNKYVIGGTIFPHKEIHKLTWKSPDNRTINQIDHFIINSKWRRSLHDVRVLRGADANSDHYLLRGTIKLKLRKAISKTNTRKKIDIAKLKLPNVKKAFCIELKNRFQALQSTDEETDTIQEKWNNIKSIFTETAEKTVGFVKSKNKEWISTDTLQKIQERKQIKQKINSTKSKRQQDQLQESKLR